MTLRGLLHAGVAALAIVGGACSGDNKGSSAGSGGGSGSGEKPGSGGSIGSAGRLASGGEAGTGGASSAGVSGSGGMSTAKTTSGGSMGSGGMSTSGGKTTSGGSTSSGGMGTTGGRTASGGSTGSGGMSTAGGKTTSGGGTGLGGTDATTVDGGAGGGTSSGSGGGRADAAAGGASGSGGTTEPAGPCDIYQAAGTPCVAAHSTVRALYATYNGLLYQVRRASDKTTKDIRVLNAGGFVDSAMQVSFCAGTTCTISHIYDQSPLKNDLPLSPPVHWLPNGGTEAVTGPGKGQAKVGGQTVFGVYIQPDGAGSGGNTYRNNKATGLAKMDEPESMYWVVDGKYYNGRCCFDYGNVQTTGNDDGNATMETLNFSTIPNWSTGSGNGPWMMADLENGVYAGALKTGKVESNTPIIANYVTGMLKGFSGNRYAIKAGDAQSGNLSVKHDGQRPPGWSPQGKQGAVELGVGGDGSSGGCGIFFEGAITTGVSSDAVDDAIQANIVAAGYGK
jgi:non-reducing end alpha-L-arabinofuranosidase